MKWIKFLLLILFFQINLCGYSQGVDKYGRITAGMQSLNQSQRDLVASPAAGLLIWCSNCAVRGELQVYNGISWINTIGGVANNAFTAPIITTTAANVISGTSASSGGTISSNGGIAVTASGVCWGTVTAPTLSDNYTTDGSTSGSFISTMTGTFISQTTYYVRSYATNVIGTTYGNEVTFVYSPPKIGDIYQGGIIFSTSIDGSGVTHGLIAATSDQGKAYWDNRLTAAAAYTGGGYTDWRLPSTGELQAMYNNRNFIGAETFNSSSQSQFYWGSNNAAGDYGQGFSFYGGGYISGGKGYTQSIRAIRSF